MFQPITITDSCQDETKVEVSGELVVVQVGDQLLADYLPEEHEGQAYARGTFTLNQARQLVEALHKAIAEVERTSPGEDVFELVDGDDYLWVFVAEVGRWACAMDLTDVDDHPTTGAASHSLFVGFDKGAADIAKKFGIKA